MIILHINIRINISGGRKYVCLKIFAEKSIVNAKKDNKKENLFNMFNLQTNQMNNDNQKFYEDNY